MAAQPGEKVKLEAMISMETRRSGEFAVVVLVTAPPALGTEHSDDSAAGTRGVDLVAVLDVSEGMNEDNRLERMQEAMFSVLEQLRPDDRLCILSFNDEVRRLMELEYMTDENWAIARARIGELNAPAGGANVKAATEAAAAILAQRGEEEQRDRVGRVIFLSNGDEDDANAGSSEKQNDANAGPSEKQNDASAGASEKQNDANAGPDPAPDAFVLGADGKLSPLSLSADNTSAAYSYVKDSIDKIQDAPGLTSVDTALAVQIDLHAQEGVAISSVESGGHPVPIGPDGPQSLTIYIQDLYAGEYKSFTVYLTVPEGNKEELLAVTGWYKDPESGEDTQLDVCEVSVPRPNAFMATVLWLSGMFAAIMNLLSLVWDSVPNILKKATKHLEGPKLGKVRIVWTWARNKLYLCALVLLLLGAAMLLVPKKPEDDGKSSGLSVSQDPGWPRVDESFTLKKMEIAGITSCFNSALVADMCPAMNRNVYQAILHDTGFHVPLLEQTAQMLEVEKEEQEYFYTRRQRRRRRPLVPARRRMKQCCVPTPMRATKI